MLLTSLEVDQCPVLLSDSNNTSFKYNVTYLKRKTRSLAQATSIYVYTQIQANRQTR